MDILTIVKQDRTASRIFKGTEQWSVYLFVCLSTSFLRYDVKERFIRNNEVAGSGDNCTSVPPSKQFEVMICQLPKLSSMVGSRKKCIKMTL